MKKDKQGRILIPRQLLETTELQLKGKAVIALAKCGEFSILPASQADEKNRIIAYITLDEKGRFFFPKYLTVDIADMFFFVEGRTLKMSRIF